MTVMSDVEHGIHEQVLARMAAKFDTPIMQNSLRSLYVEEQIGVLLGEQWVSTGADWAGWDFQTIELDGEAPIRLEVKQSAARQSWDQAGKPSRATFDIATRTGHFEGSAWFPSTVRQADVYVLAWHDRFEIDCDQTDIRQWTYLVIRASNLPLQKSISLNPARALATEVPSSQLATTVNSLAHEIRRANQPPPRRRVDGSSDHNAHP